MSEGDHSELRFVDGPHIDASVEISASPERVWELVCDINVPARFSTEFQGAEWIDGSTEAAAGARFRGHNEHPAIGRWNTSSTITTFDAPRSIEWAVEGADDKGPGATWRFDIEPTDGGCRLTQSTTMGPGRSGINHAIDAMPDKESKILQRRLSEHRVNMEATLAGIKELAEA